MEKQINEFYIKTKENVVTQIGHAVITQPVVNFNGCGIKWFDDNKLIRAKKAEVVAWELKN